MVKAVGAGIHKQIISRQNAAASAMLMDPVHGQRLKELKHAEMATAMRQRVVLTMTDFLTTICVAEGFGDALDAWHTAADKSPARSSV